MKYVQLLRVGGFGFLLSLMLSATFLRLGFEGVDGLFLPDDTYYALSIARNLFEGRGASADGLIPTSEFQPLIVLLEVPLFACLSDPQTLVLGAVAISALAGAFAAGLAGMLVARDSCQAWPGLLSGAVVAFSPGIAGNALNGLETSLAAVLMLWLLWLMQGTPGRGTLWRAVLIGLVAGASLLARIDSLFLLVPAGLWGLRRLGAGRTALVTLVAALVELPWALYCQGFGAPVPESGAAVRQIVDFHQSIGNLDPEKAVVTLFAALDLFVSGRVPLIGSLLVLGVILWALLQAWRRRALSLSTVLALSALLYIDFYLFYLPAFWFFDRYLNPVLLFAALLLGLLLGDRTATTATGRIAGGAFPRHALPRSRGRW